MYYIEGTIDAIDVFNDKFRFSLLPSSEHLVSRDNGNKEALLIDSNSTNATMVSLEKNTSGKEIVWFSFDKELRDVLLSAKNNRNTVRVWCKDLEKKDSDADVSTPPIQTIIAEGIRVF